MYKKAYETFYSEELFDSYLLFEEILEIDPGYRQAAYHAEIAYILSFENTEPLDKLFFLMDTQGKGDKFKNYWLGRIYREKYMFHEAIEAWEAFLDQKVYLSKEIKKEVRLFIRDAERILELLSRNSRYKIRQLDTVHVNSKYDDLSPAFFAGHDELLFTTNRLTKDDEVHVFHAIRDGLEWKQAEVVSVIEPFDAANSTIEVVNEDGKLFIYQDKGGRLYYSTEVDNQWQPLKEFDHEIKKAKIASHFFINDHEDRIIFSSPEGKGDYPLDLMQTFKDPETGEWSDPSPFAENINTDDYNEDSPFLSHDETRLFFSSNRPNGFGKYDIYVSRLDDETLIWSQPELLPYPINTPDDEIHFKLNPDDFSGYFSSDRITSFGDFDIFSWQEMFSTKIEGTITDHAAGGPLTSGKVVFMPLEYPEQAFESEIKEDGTYSAEIYAEEIFQVDIIKDGEVLLSDQFEVHEVDNINTVHIKDFHLNRDALIAEEQNQDQPKADEPEPESEPEPAETKDQMADQQSDAPSSDTRPLPMEVKDLSNKYRQEGKVIVHNIYFDFNSSYLREESLPVLDELLNLLRENPSIKIEIAGYTDNIGEPKYNKWLSKRRAESVRKWLIKQGIDGQRLVAKGYGEENPMASNDDEKEGRELNRRIELILIE